VALGSYPSSALCSCARQSGVRDSTTVKVAKTAGGGENLTFDRIIIATGSRPTVVPSLKLDSPRLMDSTSALDLPDVPKRCS